MAKKPGSNTNNGKTVIELDPDLLDPRRLFPEELLGKSIGERMLHFQDKAIAHRQLTEVTDQILTAIENPMPAQVICVYGPSGVGKYKLALKVIQKVIEMEMAAILCDTGYVPATYHEIRGYPAGKFYWQGEFELMMGALREPPKFVDNKLRLRAEDEQGTAPGSTGMSMTGSAQRSQYALENSLKQRRTRLLWIDEAQNLRNSSMRNLHAQIDILKSIANVTNTVIVLAGTYELLAFSEPNGHLARRTIDIHFPRYHKHIPDDLGEFADAVYTLQGNLPLRTTPNLISMIDYIYERCLGCVGILKDWLYKALGMALKEGEKRSFRAYLEATCMLDGRLVESLDEILRGEQLWANLESQKGRLASRINAPPAVSLIDAGGAVYADPAALDDKKAKAYRGGRRPGTRNPTRDIVGGDQYAS